MWRDNNEQRAPLINNKGEPNTSEEKFGKKYEHEAGFRGVKEEGRTCNDIFFGALFMLVISAMVAISLVGFTKGNPTTLVSVEEFEYLNGTDFYANQTGVYVNGTLIPESDKLILKAEAKAEWWFQDAVAVMKRDVDVLAGALAFAFILALGWIQLMRYFTKLFIYLTLILGISGIIAAGVFFLHTGIQNGSASMKNSSYAIFALAGVLIILIFILRKKIALTSALFAECCKGFQHNPTILLVGIIVFLMLAAFSIYWVTQFIYLFSVPDGDIQIPQTPYQFNTKIRNLLWFQLFAYFWVTAFLSAVFQVSVAGGMATWYFSRDIDGFRANQGSPTFRSFGRALTKSFGSLALGSLLLAAVQFLNFVLRMAKKANWKNPVARCIFGCIQCFVGIILRIVQFVDRFTYIYIAMHGQNFCSSARSVFNLIERNAFSAVVVDVLGEIILFIGKILGTAATTMFTVGIINHFGRPISAVTIGVAAVVSFRIFSLFAKIVHVGVDTVMVCYMEDLERNKDGALYMSPELHTMLQAKAQEQAGDRRVNP